jgi:hypothetical protein
MIDVKQAVNTATQFMQNLYSDPLPGLMLEEVELSDDERYWYITLGYSQTKTPSYGTLSNLKAFVDPEVTRVYKLIKVDAATGQPLSMKIRNP